MKKHILAVSIALIFTSSISLSDDSGYMDGDDPDYCEKNFNPIVCDVESEQSQYSGLTSDNVYRHEHITKKECNDYASKAVTTFFDENPKFAQGVHKYLDYPTHSLTFVDRDFLSDTKSSYGCALGLKTQLMNQPDPYTIIQYSVSETYVDGLVIYINDFDYVGVMDYDE
jgi:hypothetical protein